MPGPGRYSTRQIFPGLGRCLQTGVAEARVCRSELVLVHVLGSVIFVGGDGYMSPSIYEQMAASGPRMGSEAPRPPARHGEGSQAPSAPPTRMSPHRSGSDDPLRPVHDSTSAPPS